MNKLVLLTMAGFIFTGFTFAQDIQKEAKMGRGDATKVSSRLINPTMKVEKRTKDDNLEINAVHRKEQGTSQSQDTVMCLCHINFDNWSRWYIDCYIDGYFYGYVNPYSDGSVSVECDSISLYAITEFGIDHIDWGPVTVSCQNDSVIFTVYDNFYNWEIK